jgi:hypothetical protein
LQISALDAVHIVFSDEQMRGYGTPKGTQKNVKKKTSFAATPSSGQIWNFMQKFPFLAQKRGNFILLFVDRYSICVQARERGEEEGRMGGRRAYEKKGDPCFLFSPIRPILPSLPVFALPRNTAMLRCQIKRQKKTDPKEPHMIF